MLFLPKETRCVCRQAAGKGCQNPTPLLDSPDVKQDPIIRGHILNMYTAPSQPGPPRKAYSEQSGEKYSVTSGKSSVKVTRICQADVHVSNRERERACIDNGAQIGMYRPLPLKVYPTLSLCGAFSRVQQ
jgi:hypothetical protein